MNYTFGFASFQALALRTSKEQLFKSSNIAANQTLFDVFSGSNQIFYTPFLEAAWRSKVEAYERSLVPYAKEFLSEIRAKVANNNADTQHVKICCFYQF